MRNRNFRGNSDSDSDDGTGHLRKIFPLGSSPLKMQTDPSYPSNTVSADNRARRKKWSGEENKILLLRTYSERRS